MSWCALDVLSPEPARDAVAAWLVGRTGQAVEERPDGILVGVARSGSAGNVLDELRLAFGEAVQGSARSLPDEDWSLSWRKGLQPHWIGRLLVAPSWATPQASGAPVVIIDPETAFGSGDHGSTRSALRLLESLVRPGDRVLDLGSGSGILAIAAIKLGAARAVGVDLDPESEAVARRNALRNGVAARCEFLIGDAASLAGLLGPAELVVSNILRSENERILEALRPVLTPEGTAVFAGMETPEAATFRVRLRQHGFRIIGETRDDDWWSVAVRSE